VTRRDKKNPKSSTIKYTPRWFIFCRANIQDEWKLERGKDQPYNLLLGLTLVEWSFQLFNGEIETAVLEPKIINLIKATV